MAVAPAFTVRRATLADLDTIVDLRILFRRETSRDKNFDEEPLAAATRRYAADKMPAGEFEVWLAEADGAVVGIGGMMLFERPPLDWNLEGREAYLMNMYTVPAWRGRGIGAALVGEMVEHARSVGVKRVWLHTTEGARSLYERAGFVAAPHQMELILR